MDKKKIEIIITSVLILVFIFALSSSFRQIKGGSRKKRSSKEKAGASLSQLAVSVPKKEVSFKDLEARAANLSWGRNPFSHKSGYLVGEIGELKLDGIIWDKENPEAMIDGVILGIGERIGEYTVTGITENTVILTDGIAEIKLRL